MVTTRITVTHETPDGKASDEALLDGLTSSSDMVRCMARFAASAAQDAIVKWVEAEFDRETSSPIIFATLMTMQTQALASFAASFFPPDLDQDMEDACIADFRRLFARHVAHVRASKEAM